MKRKILISTSSFADFDNKPLELLHESGFDVIRNPYGRRITRDELLDFLPGVTGLVAGVEVLDADVLKKSELKVISRVGSGISNIDLETAEELGIKICSTPEAPVNAVAELTVGGMLGLLRQIPLMDCDLHRKKWNRQNGRQLEGKTVLIVGYGRIGKRVAELLKAFNVKLIAVDPVLKPAEDLKVMRLPEALPQADIITFHCNYEKTMLSEKEFALLKEGVFICNVARGGLVDENALVKALKDGRVAGCWLDTFEQEPYSGELVKFPQAILTPHVGSYTIECRVKMEAQAVENLLTALNGAGGLC